ncbi:hypothetical protein TNCV_2451941 [Trichonephila clavipes]|nr:hypothetical protein TNCV_2451941 [Trichonephila clavipes]
MGKKSSSWCYKDVRRRRCLLRSRPRFKITRTIASSFRVALLCYVDNYSLTEFHKEMSLSKIGDYPPKKSMLILDEIKQHCDVKSMVSRWTNELHLSRCLKQKIVLLLRG